MTATEGPHTGARSAPQEKIWGIVLKKSVVPAKYLLKKSAAGGREQFLKSFRPAGNLTLTLYTPCPSGPRW